MKLFTILFFSLIFVFLAMFYLSSAAKTTTESDVSEIFLSEPTIKNSKEKDINYLKSFFDSLPNKKLDLKEEHFLTDENIKFMESEVYETFNSEEGVDIIVILKDYNEYVLDTYTIDYNKKRIEIAKLIDSFLGDFSKEEIKLINKGEVTKFVAIHINSLETLEKIKDHELFYYLFLDKKQELHLAESRNLIEANAVRKTGPMTGRGVAVCTIDSGVEYAHPALGGCTQAQFLAGTCSKVVGGIDFYASQFGGTDNDPSDVSGHGTHVAGIIASSDSIYKGISPDASIVSVKIFDLPGTGGTFSATMAGIDWCINNSKSFVNPIRVISMSFGVGNFVSTLTPTYFDSSFIAARSAGIFLTASSGNDFSSTGINYPASSPYVFSVGSVYDSDLGHLYWPESNCEDVGASKGKLSCFTNRQNLLDILAPGSIITSTKSFNGALCASPSGTIGFSTCSGTSMAVAHVAGAAALLLEYNKSFTVSNIENILRNSGETVYDPVTSLSFPNLNLAKFLFKKSISTIQTDSEFNVGTPFNLNYFDSKNPNAGYLFLFSGSTNPGISLPVGVLRLTFDQIMYGALFNPLAFGISKINGNLDGFGYSQSQIDLPSNFPAGFTFYAAALSYNPLLPFPANVLSISSPVKITTSQPFVNLNFLSYPMPSSLGYHSCTKTFANNKIYCFGGSGAEEMQYPLDQILEYDPLIDNLVIKSAKTPEPVVGLSCVESFTSSSILCFGNNNVSNSLFVFEYDVNLEVVSLKSAVLPTTPSDWRHMSCSESFADGKIYCFGGFSSAGPSDSIIQYDYITDSFSYMSATLPEQIQSLSCTPSFNNKIYCFGGLRGWDRVLSNKILEYDPLADVLITKPSKLPYSLFGSSCKTSYVNGNIYCLGGASYYPYFPRRVLEYDPLADVLITTYDTLHVGRTGHSCGVDIFNDRIYCFGGEEISEIAQVGGVFDDIIYYDI